VSDIGLQLNSFESISLESMDGVLLMERMDTKYIFPRELFNEFLGKLKDHYEVLEVNGLRISPYETLYFDTKKFSLYLTHHNRKPSRLKIRFRKYGSTGAVFFELKFKNSKGLTLKKRIEQSVIHESIHSSAADFLTEHTQHAPSDFEAKLWVNYSRVTLVNKARTERLTFDFDLSYKNENANSSLDGLVIAEVKGEKKNHSAFGELMKTHRIRSGNISKYCIGIAKTVSGLKSNNFKRQLLSFKKLTNDTITGIN